jgi:hypothetical protein
MPWGAERKAKVKYEDVSDNLWGIVTLEIYGVALMWADFMSV